MWIKPFKEYRKRAGDNHIQHGRYKIMLPDGPVRVVRWSRYPEYDFIFGAPMKGHRLYGIEKAAIVVRNKVECSGHYLDKEELGQWCAAILRLWINTRRKK